MKAAFGVVIVCVTFYKNPADSAGQLAFSKARSRNQQRQVSEPFA
jgi:hypothetical protein